MIELKEMWDGRNEGTFLDFGKDREDKEKYEYIISFLRFSYNVRTNHYSMRHYSYLSKKSDSRGESLPVDP